MTRKFICLGAAALVLAACAKTEVVDITTVNSEVDSPVYFLTSPITKDGSTSRTKFSEDNIFESNAWYLEPNKTWAENYADGVEYIPRSEVSYMAGQTAGTYVWRTVKPYYWPKNGGTLSFYSWSLNKSDLSFGTNSKAQVNIDREKGVVLTGYDIIYDKGIDFIVADPALQQTKNLHLYYTDGVPTLFRHMLSKLKITAVADEDYSAYKKITIKEIKITGVARKASYQETEIGTDGKWHVIDRWTVDPVGGTYDDEFYDGTDSEGGKTGTPVTTKTVTFGGEDAIFIPQDFPDDAMIEITYEIYDEFSKVKETVTVKIPLKEALATTSTSKDGEFEAGTEYTINLHFTLDLVYWDPAVQNWDVENKGVTVKE